MTTVSILSMWYGMPNGMNTVDKALVVLQDISFVFIYVSYPEEIFLLTSEIDEELQYGGHFSFLWILRFSKVPTFSYSWTFFFFSTRWKYICILLGYIFPNTYYCCVKSHSVFRSSGWMLPVLPAIFCKAKCENAVLYKLWIHSSRFKNCPCGKLWKWPPLI